MWILWMPTRMRSVLLGGNCLRCLLPLWVLLVTEKMWNGTITSEYQTKPLTRERMSTAPQRPTHEKKLNWVFLIANYSPYYADYMPGRIQQVLLHKKLIEQGLVIATILTHILGCLQSGFTTLQAIKGSVCQEQKISCLFSYSSSSGSHRVIRHSLLPAQFSFCSVSHSECVAVHKVTGQDEGISKPAPATSHTLSYCSLWVYLRNGKASFPQ